ncbi:hypothetical protein BJF79_28975 [Actinomadura sp. CNU-125]|nr:hypothetical protein BJF79_28975 [Actinomadura sp. CNU-125]
MKLSSRAPQPLRVRDDGVAVPVLLDEDPVGGDPGEPFDLVAAELVGDDRDVDAVDPDGLAHAGSLIVGAYVP